MKFLPYICVILAACSALMTRTPSPVEGTSPALSVTTEAPNTTAASDVSDTAALNPAAVVSYTDGPTPLTVDQFADLQKWLKDGKPLQEWVDAHPDPALEQAPSLPEQMLAEANRLGPYRSLDPSLCRAAQDYADHLARTNQQGHFADGSPEQRAKRAGFTGSIRTPGRLHQDGWTHYGLGEVLAFGHQSIESAFQGWMASQGHKEALMEPSYDVAGFGNNGTIWVGMFGNSTGSPPEYKASPLSQLQQCGPNGCYVVPQQSTQSTRYYTQPAMQPQTYQRRGLFGGRFRRW